MNRFLGKSSAVAAILRMTARAILGGIGLAGVKDDAETWGDALAELAPRRWRWLLASIGISIGSAGMTVKVLGQTMNRWAWWELLLTFVLFVSTVSGAVMAVYQFRENSRGGTIRRLKRHEPKMHRLLNNLEKELGQSQPRHGLMIRNRARIREIVAVLEKEGIRGVGIPVNRDGHRLWTAYLANLIVLVDRNDLQGIRSLFPAMTASADRYVSPASDILTP